MISVEFRQLCYIFLIVGIIVAASTLLAVEAGDRKREY